jgi:outer membrane receptor protein involved in Fe transport
MAGLSFVELSIFLELRMRYMTTALRVLAASVLLASAPAYAAAPQCGNRTSPATSAASDESPLEIKVVTASKFAESISDAPGVMSVISHDELQRWGGVTLAEILDRVPGLNLTSAYFTDRSIVAARGDQTKVNGGHVLFLINGRPTRRFSKAGSSATCSSRSRSRRSITSRWSKARGRCSTGRTRSRRHQLITKSTI